MNSSRFFRETAVSISPAILCMVFSPTYLYLWMLFLSSTAIFAILFFAYFISSDTTFSLSVINAALIGRIDLRGAVFIYLVVVNLFPCRKKKNGMQKRTRSLLLNASGYKVLYNTKTCDLRECVEPAFEFRAL